MFILFPSPRYFHETRGRSLRYTLLTPLSSWRVLKTTSSPIRLSIFSRAHRHFRSHHSRLLVLRPRTFLMCPWLGLTLLSSAFPPPPPPPPATRAHLWCTRTSARLLELRVTKTPRLLCMYAGIRCRGGWGILFFTWIPRGVAPAPLNAPGAFRIPV